MNPQDLDNRMDQDLDRVLRGLAQATPPAHLEQRVLARIEQRQQQVTPARAVRSLALPWAFATAAIALTIATIPLLTHRHRPPQTLASNTIAAHRAPTIADNTGALPLPPAPTSTAKRTPHQGATTSTTTVRLALTQPAEAPAPLDPTTCHCDPVAIAEASAPSRPAPPLPLTRAERHMLLLLRSGETQELAVLDVLDPHLRDLEFQRERADFNRFFAPPSQPSNKNPKQQGNDLP